MVEITSEEQNKVKRMKITEDSLRILWDNIECISIWSKGSQKKKKGYETHIDWKWEDGKNISQANGKQKKAGVAILISDKIDLNIKKITIDKEEHYIMIKGSIQEEDITIVNIYAPNTGAPQYIRQTLTDIKGEIDSNTIIVGDFNTLLTPMDRSSKQKINKDYVAPTITAFTSLLR